MLQHFAHKYAITKNSVCQEKEFSSRRWRNDRGYVAVLHQRTRPSTYPLLVCYAAYFVQINKFRICNDYIKYIYLPHEQISRHIEWHLAILLQWFQADDMGAHLVADYCAQIVCDICGTALLLFPSGHARTQQWWKKRKGRAAVATEMTIIRQHVTPSPCN